MRSGCSIRSSTTKASRSSASKPRAKSLDGKHAASLAGGRPGILHGNKTYLLQDDDGQITEAHSISAGLDYPGIGPEHSWLHEIGRVRYEPVTDAEALASFQKLTKLEGIIPALESAHAIAAAERIAPTLGKDKIIIVNCSGRGDKDIFTVADALVVELCIASQDNSSASLLVFLIVVCHSGALLPLISRIFGLGDRFKSPSSGV